MARIILHANLAGGYPFHVLIEKSHRYFTEVLSQLVSDEKHSWATPYTLATLNSLLFAYISLTPTHQKLFQHSPLEGQMLLDKLQTFRSILFHTAERQSSRDSPASELGFYPIPANTQNPQEQAAD